MTERQFHKDEVIFRQGDVDYSFFRILEGSVGIFSHDSGQEERKLTELTEGQTFGEMAVIDCYPRSATAIALTEGTRVYQIDKDDLSTYLKENPELMLDMIRFLSDRLRDLTDDYSDVCAAIRELKKDGKGSGAGSLKSGLVGRIRKQISALKSKNSADSPTAEYLAELKEANHSDGYTRREQTYPKGTVICREGTTVHCMYYIREGKAGVYTGYGTDREELLAQLYQDSFFGEAGMISDKPRSATVVALENTTAEIFYMEDIEELLRKNPSKVLMILQHLTYRLRKLTAQYLEACSLLSSAAEDEEKTGQISPELADKISVYRENAF